MAWASRMTQPFRPDRRWWLVALVAAVQGLHAFWITTTPAGGWLLPWFANLLIDFSHAIALALAVVVAVRYRGSRLGLAWALVASGLAMGQFGESSWTVQELVLGREVPFPSVSDIGYVGAYPPVFLGLLLMPQAPGSPLGRLKLAADAVIVMVAAGLLSWTLIISSVLSEGGETALAMGLSVFYPLADLGIMFAAFVLVARAGGSRLALSFSLLGAGYFAAAFSDSLYVYLAEAGYETGNIIDLGWVASSSLIALAALTALSPTRASEPLPHEAGPAFWPSLLPYAAVVPLGVLLVAETGDGGSTALAGGFLAVVALIILRQVMTIHENARLNRELVDLTGALENRVREQTMELLRRGRPTGEEMPPPGERPNGADEPVGGLGPFVR